MWVFPVLVIFYSLGSDRLWVAQQTSHHCRLYKHRTLGCEISQSQVAVHPYHHPFPVEHLCYYKVRLSWQITAVAI